MTDISLITSLYKSEKFLPIYADHILDLSRQVVEQGITLEIVIIPNDASDTERQLLTQLQKTLTQQQLATMQIHYVQRETLYASWNRGFNLANGIAIGVLNVDDKRTIEGFITAKQTIIDDDYQLIDFAFHKMMDSKPHYHSAQYDSQQLSFKTVLSPFWMCHRQLFKIAGAFNPNFRILGDYEWSKRLAVRQAKSRTSDVVAGEFWLHGDNLSGTYNPLERVEANIVRIWHGAENHIQPADPDLMREVWQKWGHEGGTMSDDVAQFLWGDGALERYQRYQWERNLPKPIRHIFLALAKRGLVNSVDWDLHHG